MPENTYHTVIYVTPSWPALKKHNIVEPFGGPRPGPNELEEIGLMFQISSHFRRVSSCLHVLIPYITRFVSLPSIESDIRWPGVLERNMNQCLKVARESVKKEWDSLCHDVLGLSCEIGQTIWTAIESRYCEPGRAYHTLEHILDLIIISRQFRTKISDYTSVLLAIIFHDIIYDPKSNINEEDSAVLFVELLQEHLDGSLLTKTANYIIATTDHLPGKILDYDLLLFLDLDMSILGRERDEYSSYAAKIRMEYSHIDESAFNVGRSGFLRKTLQSHNHILLTEEFRTLMESKARSNLEWEINFLESKIHESQNIS